MLKHGRAGVPLEVMGLMLGEFVDDYTVKVVDVFAMPQSGTGVSVEAVDPVFQTKMLDMLKQVGRPEMVVGWYGVDWLLLTSIFTLTLIRAHLRSSALIRAHLRSSALIRAHPRSSTLSRSHPRSLCDSSPGIIVIPALAAGFPGWTSTRSSRSRRSTRGLLLW
jgi:hypothetical protein